MALSPPLLLLAALASPPALAAAAPPLPPPAIPSAPPVARGFAPVNGLSLYYEVHGPEGGTPLVLLHGGDPAIETTWAAALPLLARTHRVIAFDQQGHGRTADVDRPFTFEGSADDTAALLKHLGIDRADLVGFSNGATIALEAAARHPRLVRRVVFISGMVKRDGLQPGFFEGMARATVADVPPAYAAVYRATSPHPERLPSYFRKTADRLLAFRDWPDARVKAVTAPTLVVAGDADVVRAEHAVALARLIPRARLAILPLTTHDAVLGAHAAWVVPMIEEFLAAPEPR
ncbi:MAG: alpha/beta fold hydrolase [Anaeromyxobacteraceae bacterium]